MYTVCIHVHLYTYKRVDMCVRVYTHEQICIYTYTHLYIYMHMHTRQFLYAYNPTPDIRQETLSENEGQNTTEKGHLSNTISISR